MGVNVVVRTGCLKYDTLKQHAKKGKIPGVKFYREHEGSVQHVFLLTNNKGKILEVYKIGGKSINGNVEFRMGWESYDEKMLNSICKKYRVTMLDDNGIIYPYLQSEKKKKSTKRFK